MSEPPYLSLQHTEAIDRRELLDLTSYDVSLDLATDEATFASHTTIRFRSRGGATFVDLKPVSVRSITLNGDRIDPDLLRRGRVPLDTVAGDNELVVEAVMRFRNDGEGLHRSVDPADGAPLRLRHVLHGRGPQRLRLLRPARPQGALPAHRPGARGLGRHRQRPRQAGRAGLLGLRRDAAAVDVLRHPRRRARTT